MSPKRNLWSAAAALAVCALLLAACSGGGGDDEDHEPVPTAAPDETKSNAMTRLWETPPVDGAPRVSSFWINDIWVTDAAVVFVQSAGVWGYDPGSGEELWRLAPPDGADALCAATPDVNGDGIGALLYHRAQDPSGEGETGCSVVAAVDTGSGEILWSHDLSDREGSASITASGPPPLSVGEEVIAVNFNSRGYFFRFAIDGGEELPELEVPGGEDCQPYEWLHSATYTIGLSACDAVDPERTEGYVYDTESGVRLRHLSWSVTASPPTGLLPGDQLALWHYDTLTVYEDSGGQVRAEIPLQPGVDAENAVVTDSELIMRTESGLSDYRYAGLDLETGAQLWENEVPGGLWFMGHDGQVPVQYPGESVPLPHHFGWLNPRDGSVSEAGVFPRDADLLNHALVTDDPAVYAVSMPQTGDDEDQVHLVAYELPR
jgi:outer membrane protein assembly factor BamB